MFRLPIQCERSGCGNHNALFVGKSLTLVYCVPCARHLVEAHGPIVRSMTVDELNSNLTRLGLPQLTSEQIEEYNMLRSNTSNLVGKLAE
jgi:ribosomal protein S27E